MKSKHILSFFVTLALLVWMLPWVAVPARADEAITNETKVLHGGKTYTVSGTVTTGRLECSVNYDAKSVTLHLNEGCTLNTKGIKVDRGVTLTIEGSGTLNVNQSTDDEYCQGINTNGSSGKIIITGGNINTKGRGVYPGIGGQDAVIEITGGTVNATGGGSSAGIGGGSDGGNNIWNYSSISITGGSVTATGGTIATGFGASAGIGGAKNGGGGPISITGGTVNATGGTSAIGGAAGIGSGYMGSVGNITISGNAEVTARGTTGTGTRGSGGAGIGSGDQGSVGDITIIGGTLTSVTGGDGAAGIGDGHKSTARGTITISGGTLTKVQGGFNAAGIGGGSSTPGGTITITGGTLVSISGGDYGAGIGGGGYGIGGNITISGTANVTAAGGISAAGIGGGDQSEGGTISISGGTVTATGGGDVTLISYAGAGIGGGGNAMAGSITISGGNVTSTGGAAKSGEKTGAGIGSGGNKSGGSIKISGGTVTANAGAFTENFYGSNHGAVAIGRANVTLIHTKNAAYPIITAKSKINAYSGSVTLEKDFAYQDTSNIVTTPIKNNSTIVPAEAWTVTFDSNGGEGTMAAQKVAKGNSLTLAANTFTNTSYTFTGWNTAADGSGNNSYADKASVTPTDNMTLYAQWKHEHSFTYALSDDGKTITATCEHEVCTLTDHKASLTIAAPTSLIYDRTNKAAVISGDTDTLGTPNISYTKDGLAFGETPMNAGAYTAGFTVGGQTASVSYTITPKSLTVSGITAAERAYKPENLTVQSFSGGILSGVIEGDTVSLDLTNAIGTMADANAGENKLLTMTGVGLSGEAAGNYSLTQPTDVTVTITRADNPVAVSEKASVKVGGNTVELDDNVRLNGAAGAVSYEISGEKMGCSIDENGVLTSGDETGTVTVNVTVAEDSNYNALATTTITVTITEKDTQTITADDVTVTFGDTNKSISAATDGDGTLSYAVKSGDAVTVDPSTGALTIVKAGTAVVTVTASGTAAFEQAAKDVIVTVNKAAPTVTAPTAKTLTYTGSAQELVNAGSTNDGEIQYAIGTATEATQPFTTSIPKGTEVGTYYVWYKVVGDENHEDLEAEGPVTVKITQEPTAEPTVEPTAEPTAEPTDTPTPEPEPLKLPVKISCVNGQTANYGFPDDIKETELTLTLNIKQGNEVVSVGTVKMKAVPGAEGKFDLDALPFTKPIPDFPEKWENYTYDSASITPQKVTVDIYGAGGKLPEYRLTVKPEFNGTNYTVYILWNKWSEAPTPEPIRVVALPEDEIGAYQLREDGTKEYLIFQTYDICMAYLGRDELCRGPERCYHK